MLFLPLRSLFGEKQSILPEIIPASLSSSCHISVGTLLVHAHALVHGKTCLAHVCICPFEGEGSGLHTQFKHLILH